MAYIGFDLDETLGCFGSLHNHLLFLTPGSVYQNILKGAQTMVPSVELVAKLETAIKEFGACLASKDDELKILRRGILPIMKRLLEAKQQGLVNAISIYSNNGNLGLLRIASVMIEHALNAPGLFCNHIDWHNPLRSAERTPGVPGKATKSALVLRQSFLDPRCGNLEVANAVPAGQLYFFDDNIHSNIYLAVGAENYFRVSPYADEPTDLRPIDACFVNAMNTSGLANDDEYLTYIKPLLAAFGSSNNTLEGIVDTIQSVNAATFKPKKVPFADDTAEILARLNAVFPPPDYGANYFPVVDGGRRRMRRRTAVKKMKKKTKKHTRRHRKARKN